LKTDVTQGATPFAPITIRLTIETAAEAREVLKQLGNTTGSTLSPAYSHLTELASKGVF
jgi:hypothetical protein